MGSSIVFVIYLSFFGHLPLSFFCHWDYHFLVILDLVDISIVILVSSFCYFGVVFVSFWWGAEGGRAGQGANRNLHISRGIFIFCHFGVIFWSFWSRFFCHFGVILLPSWNHFLSFWWGAEGGRKDGAGHQTEICTFPEPLSFFVILVSFLCHFGGARREGGWGRAPDRNLHISRGIVIFFGVIFCHLVGCGTREGRAG